MYKILSGIYLICKEIATLQFSFDASLHLQLCICNTDEFLGGDVLKIALPMFQLCGQCLYTDAV